jgi:hypothetical protein
MSDLLVRDRSRLISRFGMLMEAKPDGGGEWVRSCKPWQVIFCVATVVVGAGLYGAAMGIWREPLQALYTGVKLPLLILLTTAGNALINGMLAPLLGLNMGFRQSSMAVLMTFTIASGILGALSPVALFVVWNTPPLTGMTSLKSTEYGFLQLTLVVFIAFAGVTGNRRLMPLLREWCRSVGTARRVLIAWLMVNLLLGSQICWILRPFIWDPARPVEFVGPEYWRGSFYETVFRALERMVF